MATGLEAKTVYNTWQPEPYGPNSFQGRQGVEGLFILIKIPDVQLDNIPMKPFVANSLELIRVNIILIITCCLRHLKIKIQTDLYGSHKRNLRHYHP